MTLVTGLLQIVIRSTDCCEFGLSIGNWFVCGIVRNWNGPVLRVYQNPDAPVIKDNMLLAPTVASRWRYGP